MRTTLDLDEALLRKAMESTGETKKTAVIERGLALLVQQAAAQRLARLYGKIPGARGAPRRKAKAPTP